MLADRRVHRWPRYRLHVGDLARWDSDHPVGRQDRLGRLLSPDQRLPRHDLEPPMITRPPRPPRAVRVAPPARTAPTPERDPAIALGGLLALAAVGALCVVAALVWYVVGATYQP